MPSQQRSDGAPPAPAVVKPFYCREWVFAKIGQLLDARQSDKMALSGVVICGEPGAGKTAVCTEMVRGGASARLVSDRVLASHFLNGYEPDSRSVAAFVAGVVHQLTERLDGFADKLRHADAADWLDAAKIKSDPDEAFQRTVLFPLLEMDAPGKNMLLVVDSLDEPGHGAGTGDFDDDDKSQTIAELLANHHHLFPPWLLLVVTLKRSNKALARLFTGFKKIALDQVKRSAVVRDVQQYILARLEREPGLRRHLTRETAPALNMLHIKSHGCLLYVEAVLDGVADGSVLLRDIPEIPGTLNGLYLWLCQRLFTRRGWNKVQPLIGCLLAARRPPTLDELYALSQTIDAKATRSDFKRRMHAIRKLVVPAGSDGTGRAVFHSSFGQWLLDVKHCTQRFLVNLGDGHARWALALAARSSQLTPGELDDLTFHLGRMTVESPLESWHLPLWLLWTKTPLPDRQVLEVMASSLGAAVDEQNQIEQQLVSPDPLVDQQVDYQVDSRVDNQLVQVAQVPDLPALSLADETTSPETEPTVRRASMEENDDDDVQPTEEASLVERRNSIRYLRQRDHSLNDSDDPEQTLFYASQMGYCSAVQKLCTRYRTSINQAALRHALSIASRQGHANLVAVLVECGADADAADAQGWTPLRAAAWAGHAATVRVLLERGAQVDACDAEGRTALRAAAWAGHEEVVRLLLAAGAGVDGQDKQGRTPLIAAAYMGHADIVSALLDAGAHPDHVDCEGRTALSVAVLSVACRSGEEHATKRPPGASRRRPRQQQEPVYENRRNGTLDGDDNEAVETVAILIEHGAAVNHQDKEGMTPLLVAAFEGHGTVCELLLEADADVDLADVGGRTPLLAAASTGHGHIVELLLFWGCYVDSIDAEGRTVLSVAAAQGSVDVVRLLLDRGLDEAHRDNAGWTPLHYAALEGHAAVVGLLAEVGARTDATDNDGRAPLLLASQEGHAGVVAKLIELGADVDQKSLDGKSPLRVAALEGHVDVMTALVLAGADVTGSDADGRSVLYMLAIENKVAQAEIILKAGKYDMETDRDLEGRTPLHIAAWQGHTGTVELLLRHGADVNATDREQRTPLQSAAWQGHESVVWLLLKAGARSDQPCSQGATPLSIASQEGHEGVARLLLAAGADPNRADGCGRTALKLAMKGGHKKVIQLLENWSATCAKSVASSNEAGSHRYLSAINGLDSSGKDYSPASTFDTTSGKSGSNLTSTPRSSSHTMADAMSFTQQLQQQARGSRSRTAGIQLPLFQSSRILSPLSEPQSPLYASPPPPTPPEEHPPDVWQPIQQTPPLERHHILHDPVTNGRSKSSLMRRERSGDSFNERSNPPVPHRTSSVIDPDRIPITSVPMRADKESPARPSSVPLTQSGHMQIILGLPSKTRRNGFGHHRPAPLPRDHHHAGGGLSGVLAGIRNSALMHGSTKLKNALCNAVSRPVGVVSKKETQL